MIAPGLHGMTVTLTIGCPCEKCKAAWARYHEQVKR